MSIASVVREDPFDEPTQVDLEAGLPAVVYRQPGVTLADLPGIFDTRYGELAQAGPIGPGYARYVGDVTEAFDLEIGFPVAEVPDGFTGGTFPSGRALAQTHKGGFDGLGGAWEQLITALVAGGYGAPTALVEIYVTDPSVTAERDLRTDLFALY